MGAEPPNSFAMPQQPTIETAGAPDGPWAEAVPTALLVLADGSADPETVAADLLAQAEHDVDAVPWLVTPSAALADAVDGALARQLSALPEPSRSTAAAAVGNGAAVIVADLAEGRAVADRIAPEHLEVLGAEAEAEGRSLAHWGGLFLGAGSAEVLGDYGAGPNHTLPTGGTARSTGGLSVLTFLRVRTWMDLERADPALVEDAVALARLEGLEAHARSAERRR